MTLVSGLVSIQSVCVDNLMRIVQLILCLTVNKLSNNNCMYKCLYLRSVRSVSLRRKDTHTCSTRSAGVKLSVVRTSSEM